MKSSIVAGNRDEERGAVFTITVPVRPTPHGRIVTRPLRILVVDDEPPIGASSYQLRGTGLRDV